MIRPAATKINQDHWGFYEVGGTKFYSKLQAIEFSTKTKQPVKFNYNNQVFDRFDWSKEPHGTLDHWYTMRAHQIRDKYDYIVLFYSGGADSYNMLMTFVENGIYIDEIAHLHSMDAYNGDKKAEPNEEIFFTSIPNTQKLLENHPLYKHTVHRAIDITAWEVQVLSKRELKWDWYYNTNNWYSPWTLCLANIREADPAYGQLAEKGKTVCFLFGVEKPDIKADQNGFSVVYSEMALSAFVSPFSQMANCEWHKSEGFYWTPDLPELACKQAHIVRRFMQNLTPKMIDNVHVTGGTKFSEKEQDFSLWPKCEVRVDDTWYQLTDQGLIRLIYSYRTPDVATCPKPKSAFFGGKDAWLWNPMAPDLGQRRYQKSVLWYRNYVRSLDPSWWWELKMDPKKGLPYNGGLRSMRNAYSLEPSMQEKKTLGARKLNRSY